LPTLLTVALSVSACGSGSKKVFIKTEHEPDAAFELYVDYRWVPEDREWTYPLFLRYPEIPRVIQSSVDRELALKGFRRLDQGKADFLVAVSVSIEDVTVVTTHRYQGWSHGYNRSRMTNTRMGTRLDKMPEGTLVLEVIDAASERVVWQGRAAGVIVDRGSIDEGVKGAVVRMLAAFPPEG
jgi:hypothetical protein